MSTNANQYEHQWAPEIYDRHETQVDDVEFIRSLLGEHRRQAGPDRPLRVLETCCGTGRILIPLAEAGHEMVGIDQSPGMLERAQQKLAALPAHTRERTTLIQSDVTVDPWPVGFDVVLLAGNCFYELATSAEQETCIASAGAALLPGGHVLVDNDHMEGPLPASWTRPGLHKTRYGGKLTDGTVIEHWTQNLDCDAPGRIWRARRVVRLIRPDGRQEEHVRLQQKHPVSFTEVEGWLTKHGFVIEGTFGDHQGNPYRPESPRAIFWARKETAK